MVSKETDTDTWDEDRLVALLKQGHEGAFRVLVRQYQDKLFGIAYGITMEREESLDIVQDVFFKVSRHIHTFQGKAKLSTWLRRITINECLNWQRRWKRRLRWHHQPLERDDAGDCPELATNKYSPGALFQEKELEKLFWERLKKLPEEARAVFVLKEVEGLSYDEIAGILKIKRGTVSSRLFYARENLRKSLKEYLSEGEIQ